jgi:hypothetical protein
MGTGEGLWEKGKIEDIETYKRISLYSVADLLRGHVGASTCGIALCGDLLNKQVRVLVTMTAMMLRPAILCMKLDVIPVVSLHTPNYIL